MRWAGLGAFISMVIASVLLALGYMQNSQNEYYDTGTNTIDYKYIVQIWLIYFFVFLIPGLIVAFIVRMIVGDSAHE